MNGWVIAVGVVLVVASLLAVGLTLFALSVELARLRVSVAEAIEETKATRKRVNELEPRTPAAKPAEKRISEWIGGKQ